MLHITRRDGPLLMLCGKGPDGLMWCYADQTIWYKDGVLGHRELCPECTDVAMAQAARASEVEWMTAEDAVEVFRG